MADRLALRAMERGAYDIQRLRIETGNRLVNNFRAKLGQKPPLKTEDLDQDAQDILDQLKKDYTSVTDGVKRFPTRKKFTHHGLISDYAELCLVAQYHDLESEEKTLFRRLTSVLEEFPIYTEFLHDIKGIGPAMAAVIISEIDVHQAKYPSSLWAYAGLDVARDGFGRSRRKEHLVDREYTTKDGEIKKRNSITYNPWLKTKLIGVLGTSFLRVGANPYRDIYDDYKHRLESHPKYGTQNEGKAYEDGSRKGEKITSKGHRHNMAIRYMVKQFLKDLYNAWRPLEGLEVAPTYEEAKLGRKHEARGERGGAKAAA